MKTFLKYDYYFQLFLLLAGIGLILTELLFTGLAYSGALYVFIGGAQLLSFLIRLCMPYKKSVHYIVYGFMILPVWLIIMLFLLDGINDGASRKLFLYCLIAALFYSPLMAISYIMDCRATYRRLTFRIQKFLNLSN
ncbi:hypothetical protein DBR32_00825 [Taibaiella sp. KBW10]|uniref:hypothetical protein n=1 Tax=Taibaiella sp. KBW10 TaxID=2153357 RepID=UPI000F5B5F66|nr:hypothetical protein [Taibaiella sp. KBW10]RQO32190.1 hypothetical protein DBR32_00825 [Taibaiella sp. KBW10]